MVFVENWAHTVGTKFEEFLNKTYINNCLAKKHRKNGRFSKIFFDNKRFKCRIKLLIFANFYKG